MRFYCLDIYGIDGDCRNLVSGFTGHEGTEMCIRDSFRSGKGRTLGQLSDYAYAPNDIVLKENAAAQLFHTQDAHGKRCVTLSLIHI